MSKKLWNPHLGAVFNRESNTTKFSVWSPTAKTIELILTNEKGDQIAEPIALERGERDIWQKTLDIQHGALYKVSSCCLLMMVVMNEKDSSNNNSFCED